MRVTVYTKDDCPFCVMAKKWLNENNLEYDEEDLNDNAKRQEFYESCGEDVTTVPQIFMQSTDDSDKVRIGGFKELIQSDILDHKALDLSDTDF